MSLVVSLLVTALLCGCVSIILHAALEADPTPSRSGYLPMLIIFAGATIILFALTVVSWLATMIIAVLT